MQQNTDKGDAASHRKPRGKKAGWWAFVLGMVGMFVILAVWVVLVEMGQDPQADVNFIGQAQSSDAGPPETTSDYR
ncbi:uncharacterized membrane protein YdcZ (DUF606 family) [Brevundimonas sp. 1080]|uniref:hypothetical protein n=1 Tax=Brevundimonas sp. 1080 TaxID=3156405 RepID=UPI00339AD244